MDFLMISILSVTFPRTSKIAGSRMYYSCYYIFTFLSFWWSIGCAVADDHGVAFLYPTENLRFNYLDTIDVTYTSPFPAPQLWIFCQNATDVTSGVITERTKVSINPYNGTAPVKFKWLGGSPCWFDIKPDNQGGLGANSPHFVVEQNKRATPATLGLGSSTTTATSTLPASSDAGNDGQDDTTNPATSTPTPTSDVSSHTTSSSSSSAQNHSSSGLSAGAKAGIGIGFALVALLALAGGFFFWRRKQMGKIRDSRVSEQGVNEKMSRDANAELADRSMVFPQETLAYEMDAPEHQYEMPGTRPVGELSGDGLGRGSGYVRERDGRSPSPTSARSL